MGLFGKIKQMLGIGTVSVKLNVPGNVNEADASVKGSMTLTGKSAQKIASIKVELEEEFTTGRGDDKKTKYFNLGNWNDNTAFEMAEGETKTIDFVLPFQIAKTSNQQLAEKGGMMGGLGKLASMAAAEKSAYFVKVVVDVEGAKLDPSDKVEIKIAR